MPPPFDTSHTPASLDASAFGDVGKSTAGWLYVATGDMRMQVDPMVGSGTPCAAPDCPPLNSEEQFALIGASHSRSSAYGLQQLDTPDFSTVARAVMNQALEENRLLFQHAAPIMETLYHQIANTHSMVLLTARNGMVLHSLGDADFLDRAAQVALWPGADWSEKSKGTNAIGTALAEERPVVVHGTQHYLEANRFLTCSCTPILDPLGKVIGALDVTGDHRSYHQHTMALARMSAQMIENHLYAALFPKDIIIRFHSRPEFLGTLMEGIVVVTPEGRFITANRSAQFQLGQSINALGGRTFASLFGVTVAQFHDRARTALHCRVALCLYNGVTVCCVSDAKPLRAFEAMGLAQNGLSTAAPNSPLEQRPAPLGSKVVDSKAALSSLRYLDTGDPQVAAAIQRLYKFRDSDIPVMILGETGTGKDLLAQAIHNDSRRSQHAFVSVNCASIPETLIESELFGYEEGAFTGAKRKGSQGKVLQANGGTLFLDEIGDMPKHLQARLLRVLQERRVSPLGAGKEIDVDVAVICATNKNLKALITQGDFREDLYYRLNGLVVKLPALRERKDLEVVVRRILATLCRSPHPMGITPEAMSLFRQYSWPGNFRQLFNVLRTAVVLADSAQEMGVEHLPDDFLSELQEVDLVPAHCALPTASNLVAQATPLAASASAPSAALADPMGAETLDKVALDAMAQALRTARGNVSLAAKMLGVSRNTIYRKKTQLPDDVWY